MLGTGTPKLPDLKVLLVDDLGSARKILVKILKNIGISQIDEAINGQEALNKACACSYDIIISDWEMPIMNGLELLKNIRSESNNSQLPFIMITSHNKKELVLEAADAGISDFVSKPFTEAVLCLKIENALKRPILKVHKEN